MRGVVSGGMITALEASGLLHCFDSIHGSSAGACAGAYFLAGQARLGTQIYYEDVNNSHFINRWRPFVGRPIMNTHYLIDDVMRFSKPLAVQAILGTSDVLHIVATDADTGKARVYSRFRDAEHFFAILKGSVTIPIIAGSAVTVDGRRLVDGGIVQQIAIKSAMDIGASHILVLMTRRDGELERAVNTVSITLESLGLRIFHGANLAAAYQRRNPGINETLAYIKAPHPIVRIEAIARPHNALEIDRLTTCSELLRRADKEAQLAVFNYLDELAA